jgi:hypothetical protein
LISTDLLVALELERDYNMSVRFYIIFNKKTMAKGQDKKKEKKKPKKEKVKK